MTTIFPRWCSDRLFVAPAAFYASVQSSLGYVQPLRPMIQRHRFALKGQVSIVALVAVLRSGRGPSAIIRLVVAVILHAINGMFRGWAVSHVRKEGSKRAPPLVTNGNTPRSVVVEIPIVGIVASKAHRDPRLVFWRLTHAVLDVYVMFLEHFTAMASTRGRMPVSQVANHDAGELAAIALTPRAQVSWGITLKSHYDKFREALTRNSLSRRHSAIVSLKEMAVERLD